MEIIYTLSKGAIIAAAPTTWIRTEKHSWAAYVKLPIGVVLFKITVTKAVLLRNTKPKLAFSGPDKLRSV